MKHIPADTLAKLKQLLLDQRAKLIDVVQTVDAENPVNDTSRLTNNASPDADATEEISMITSEVVGGQANDSLTRVEDALKRIEEGTYGLTADGKEIPVDRLLADPTATTLVHA